jgi:ectoine hydroxylase-related dioxygenase (phytanoyl-CoA dioxygenase family)
VYVYFYLSDTDRHSGAHVVVAGSHKAKPLRMKLGSTRQPEHAVLRRYGADKVVVLEGAAGFGFLEVPSCFHKVLPPRTSSRLLLQLRYS